jgi:hypothetical protein
MSPFLAIDLAAHARSQRVDCETVARLSGWIGRDRPLQIVGGIGIPAGRLGGFTDDIR